MKRFVSFQNQMSGANCAFQLSDTGYVTLPLKQRYKILKAACFVSFLVDGYLAYRNGDLIYNNVADGIVYKYTGYDGIVRLFANDGSFGNVYHQNEITLTNFDSAAKKEDIYFKMNEEVHFEQLLFDGSQIGLNPIFNLGATSSDAEFNVLEASYVIIMDFQLLIDDLRKDNQELNQRIEFQEPDRFGLGIEGSSWRHKS